MPTLDWNIDFPLWFGPADAAPLTLEQRQVGDPLRAELVQYIQQRFFDTHGADVQMFMPELLGLRSADGEVCASAGIRLAGHEPLFLEHYLDGPIEQAGMELIGRPLARASIVEVGNLAASNLGSARLCIITVTWLLALRGLEWVTFTGNASLVNSFTRLGLRPVTLCAADPLRLGEHRHDWGRYYQTRPHVHIGNIRAGFAHLQGLGLFERYGLPLPLETHCHVA